MKNNLVGHNLKLSCQVLFSVFELNLKKKWKEDTKRKAHEPNVTKRG